MCFFLLLFFACLFFKSPLLSAGGMRFSKNIKETLDQFVTLKRAKIGPALNFTACIYIYIYIHTPHPPLLGQKASLRGGPGGYLETPPPPSRQEFETEIPPFFHAPPYPRRLFSEVGGGWGVYEKSSLPFAVSYACPQALAIKQPPVRFTGR